MTYLNYINYNARLYGNDYYSTRVGLVSTLLLDKVRITKWQMVSFSFVSNIFYYYEHLPTHILQYPMKQCFLRLYCTFIREAITHDSNANTTIPWTSSRRILYSYIVYSFWKTCQPNFSSFDVTGTIFSNSSISKDTHLLVLAHNVNVNWSWLVKNTLTLIEKK